MTTPHDRIAKAIFAVIWNPSADPVEGWPIVRPLYDEAADAVLAAPLTDDGATLADLLALWNLHIAGKVVIGRDEDDAMYIGDPFWFQRRTDPDERGRIWTFPEKHKTLLDAVRAATEPKP